GGGGERVGDGVVGQEGADDAVDHAGDARGSGVDGQVLQYGEVGARELEVFGEVVADLDEAGVTGGGGGQGVGVAAGQGHADGGDGQIGRASGRARGEVWWG